MTNVDRLAKHIAKNGAENVMIHTIPGTSNWIICQKIEEDKWLLTMGAPMGNVTYNLGTVTNNQHLQLWEELTRLEVEKKGSQVMLANQLRDKIYNFKKKYETTYKKFIKVEERKSQPIRKMSRKHPRLKSSKKIRLRNASKQRRI